MAVLETEIYNNVIEVGKKAVAALQSNDLENFEQYAEQGWQKFPEPRENWNQAYNYAKMVFNGAFKNGRFETVKIWLNRMIANNNNLHNFDGEIEFFIGIYKFEVGLYEEALEYFMIATREGGGVRYFENQDKKYREFYKNPEKTKAGLTREKNKTEVKEKYEFIE